MALFSSKIGERGMAGVGIGAGAEERGRAAAAAAVGVGAVVGISPCV